jgi:hypothetical protein
MMAFSKLKVLLCLLPLLAACARMGVPPGGPEDKQPPFVAAVFPPADSAGVGVRPTVVLTFNEKVQQELVRQFIEFSPDAGRLELKWDGMAVAVTPADSLRSDVTYRVRVRPGVVDMHKVKSDSSFVSYFSTGAQPDGCEISGKVTTGDTAVFGAVVRAAWMKDTSLVYDAYTDSSGVYRLPYLRGGGYRMLAFKDANRNRRFEFTREAGADTLISVVFDPVTVDFAISVADTTAPLFRSAEIADSLSVRLLFDDVLDTLQTLAPEQFTLLSPDSSGAELAVDSAAVDRKDLTRILLYPSRQLVEGTSYHIRVSNIVNRAGLTLPDAARPFTFTPPKGPRGRGGPPKR